MPERTIVRSRRTGAVARPFGAPSGRSEEQARRGKVTSARERVSRRRREVPPHPRKVVSKQRIKVATLRKNGLVHRQ